MAMKMQQKAEDYVSVLGQKVGKAITISDNSQNYYPTNVRDDAYGKDESATPRQNTRY
jgi:uncharacterized protein YggE